MNQISVEVVTEENFFDSLHDQWHQLFAATECSSPFLSWEWLSVWYQWFGADRTPFVLKAFRDKQLIGLFPLCSQEKKVLGMRLKLLAFIGEQVGGADYLDVIAKTEDKAEIYSAVLEFLKREKLFDLISLENMASDSAAVTGLQNINGKSDLSGICVPTAICPRINLSGGWETILKESKRASNFKRKLKQLEKIPDFEFRTITAPDETGAAFERFFRLHEQRWSKEGGSELSGHPRLVSFQRNLISGLADSGLLRFDELWADGECRASVYALDNGNTFYYYNAGYDLEWANYSVGLVLIGLSVKNAVGRGNSVYDFLRGEETYKFDWANDKSELVTVNLSRRTAPALAHEGLTRIWRNLRMLSKFVLPDDLAETLKSRKRSWKRKNQLTGLETEAVQKAL